MRHCGTLDVVNTCTNGISHFFNESDLNIRTGQMNRLISTDRNSSEKNNRSMPIAASQMPIVLAVSSGNS